jgi:hypothetical protein
MTSENRSEELDTLSTTNLPQHRRYGSIRQVANVLAKGLKKTSEERKAAVGHLSFNPARCVAG